MVTAILAGLALVEAVAAQWYFYCLQAEAKWRKDLIEALLEESRKDG